MAASPTTALTLITRALKMLGVLAEGEVPTKEQQEDGFATLNELIDAWNTEDLLLPVATRQTFTLSASQSSRTLGPTGQLVATRPMDLDDLSVIPVSQTNEIPVRIIRDRHEWARITVKTLTNDWPLVALFEPTVPNATLSFYPVPTTACTLVVYSLTPLTQFADINTTSYDLQPGFVRALRSNLAIEWAPEFGESATVTPLILQMATESKANLKRKNQRVLDLPVDPGILGDLGAQPMSIYTDS